MTHYLDNSVLNLMQSIDMVEELYSSRNTCTCRDAPCQLHPLNYNARDCAAKIEELMRDAEKIHCLQQERACVSERLLSCWTCLLQSHDAFMHVFTHTTLHSKL